MVCKFIEACAGGAAVDEEEGNILKAKAVDLEQAVFQFCIHDRSKV